MSREKFPVINFNLKKSIFLLNFIYKYFELQVLLKRISILLFKILLIIDKEKENVNYMSI